MDKMKGNSLLETRRKNRVLIKNLIFRKKNALRTDLARELGLTLPTITTSVNEMLQERILEESAPVDSPRSKAAGRRPTMLSFRAGTASAIGIELGPYATTAVLMDIRGNVIRSAEDKAASEYYEEMKQDVCRLVRELLPLADDSLLGIGVGLPGFIDTGKGVIRSNFRTDWVGRNFAADLEEALGLSVLLDNNVRLRAVGHSMCAPESDPGTFAYLFVSKGIACPLILNHELLSGYSSGAGELGQTILSVMPAESGGTPVYRTVDELAGERAIFERCQERLLRGEMRPLFARMQKEGIMTRDMILDLQRGKDPEVCEVMSETVEYLGAALANVVNLINPGYVVVDAYIMKNEENRERLLECARGRFYGLNEEEVKIRFTDNSAEQGAVGAAYRVIQKQFLDR